MDQTVIRLLASALETDPKLTFEVALGRALECTGADLRAEHESRNLPASGPLAAAFWRGMVAPPPPPFDPSEAPVVKALTALASRVMEMAAQVAALTERLAAAEAPAQGRLFDAA